MSILPSDTSKGQNPGLCCAPGSNRRAIFWGAALLLLGTFGLLSILFPEQPLGRAVLPAFLLLCGGALLLGARRTQ